MTIIHRGQIQRQTVANLISAGIVKQEDAEHCYNELTALPIRELLSTMIDSHQLREDCTNPIDYYPIGEISLN